MHLHCHHPHCKWMLYSSDVTTDISQSHSCLLCTQLKTILENAPLASPTFSMVLLGAPILWTQPPPWSQPGFPRNCLPEEPAVPMPQQEKSAPFPHTMGPQSGCGDDVFTTPPPPASGESSCGLDTMQPLFFIHYPCCALILHNSVIPYWIPSWRTPFRCYYTGSSAKLFATQLGPKWKLYLVFTIPWKLTPISIFLFSPNKMSKYIFCDERTSERMVKGQKALRFDMLTVLSSHLLMAEFPSSSPFHSVSDAEVHASTHPCPCGLSLPTRAESSAFRSGFDRMLLPVYLLLVFWKALESLRNPCSSVEAAVLADTLQFDHIRDSQMVLISYQREHPIAQPLISRTSALHRGSGKPYLSHGSWARADYWKP